MNIIFMGTPKFAADILQGLIINNICDVSVVYTMPDAIRGRGNKLIASDVKITALDNNIKIETPNNFKNAKDIEILKNYKPDLIIVAAYGLLLPKAVLDIPKFGCINIHGSLLPKWRGAAPLQRSILAGDECTGISVMKMDTGLDTGDYCLQKKVKIHNKNLNELYLELSSLGVTAISEFLNNLKNNNVTWIHQNNDEATYANKIQKRELWLKSEDNDIIAFRKIKASSSEAPAKCCIFDKNVTIIDAKLVDGKLEILKIKPDGKNVMDWKSFIAGIHNNNCDNLIWKTIE